MREVYIGQGQTITVEDKVGSANILDFRKLIEVLEKYKDDNHVITVGCNQDWYWTATQVTLENVRTRSFVQASSWDEFRIEVEKDGEVIETINPTILVSDRIYESIFTDGIKRGIGKIEFWITGLHSEIISKLEYQDLEQLQNDMEPILETYRAKALKGKNECA